MYIQITDKCNMTCKHCCFACTRKGQDMSLEVVEKAVALAEGYDSTLIIGGGEPTLHPSFWEIISIALAAKIESPPWLATNGSIPSIALRLAGMARKGVLGAALSLDEWHDPTMVSKEVREAFEHPHSYDPYNVKGSNDLREIRSISHLVKAGRAKKLNPEAYHLSHDNKCACDEIFIRPNGDIHECGCMDSPKIGNILHLSEIKEETIAEVMCDQCWREHLKEREEQAKARAKDEAKAKAKKVLVEA